MSSAASLTPVPAPLADPIAEGLTPQPLSGWGGHPIIEGYERKGEDIERITEGVVLSRGLGRSYGDSSLPPPGRKIVACTTLADRLISFDPETGLLRAEAGFTLMNLNRLFLPRGWFTPVTPGTHWVTLGGMVAADVHGKMHHSAGCFGEHVRSLRLRVADGRIVDCSDDVHRDLFRATIGGMGLTGHILEVEFWMERISTPWIWQESERIADFEATLERLEAAGREWPSTVCWNDMLAKGSKLGRGLLIKGRWAEPGKAPSKMPRFRHAPAIPFYLPNFAGNRVTATIFNWMVYTKHLDRARTSVVHPEIYYYPLDVVRQWNRLYGRRGFTQHQAVLPGPMNHPRHLQYVRLLERLRAPVFLCVVKDCGPEGKGMLSFPKPGVSYALDMPIESNTQQLIDRMNDFVVAEGGRIYLAKDAFTRAEHFRAMEPRLDAFLAVRRKWDPEGRLKSAQSIRVLGDPP